MTYCRAPIRRGDAIYLGVSGGQALTAPLDVTTDVAWVGYANQALADQVGPALRHVLAEHGVEV